MSLAVPPTCLSAGPFSFAALAAKSLKLFERHPGDFA
jgi:hypothetical protein